MRFKIVIALWTAFFTLGYGETRIFYIGIEKIQWDYYPVHANNRSLNGGPNGDQCYNAPFEEDQLLFVGAAEAINSDGFIPTSVYEKTVFREFTDSSFTTLKPRRRDEEHLALLGPLLRVAVGDVLVVVLRGLKETIPGEENCFGFEIDGLHGTDQFPTVCPGMIVRLKYHVRTLNAPSPRAFVDSKLLLYRGTVGSGPDGSAGIYRGLSGAAIVYRKNALLPNGRPRHIDTELVTVLWVANENRGGEEGDVEESNLMHGINGRVYCSVPALEMTKDKRVRWYFGGVGNEVDIHTAHMHGVVGFNSAGTNTDVVRILPGSTSSLEMIPDNVGTWLYHCHINDHLHAGMIALVIVKDNGKPRLDALPSTAQERVYYVQAEDVEWDYAPKGINVCENRAFNNDELIFVQKRFQVELQDGTMANGIGSKYQKTRYFEYTDATFTTRVKRSAHMQHLGVMGPVLRARIGEVIVVHFRNLAKEPTSMHPHGVFYTKAHEGAPYNDGTSGDDKNDDAVPTGGRHTYRWEVPARAGPGPGEHEEMKLWMYHSHRNEISDTYAGLFGIILVIAKPDNFDPDTLMPTDGSREVFVHMSVMNEGGSFHIEENTRRSNTNLPAIKLEELLENETFRESNLMHSINGYVYCNNPSFRLRLGQKSRFFFYALGTEVDIHTPQIGNEALQLDVASNRGTGMLLGGSFSSAIVIPRSAGLNEMRCNVNDHVVAGMRATYFVEGGSRKMHDKVSKVDVTHFIAAEEMAWDYTPLQKDGCNLKSFGEEEMVFTKPGNFTPGSLYRKSVYREYGDGSFTWHKRNRMRSFAGIVGPLLHFAVGETVKIVFRNKLSFSVNMNMIGLELLDSSSETLGVAPGQTVVYTYRVRSEAGPADADLSAVAKVYYSSVDPIRHTHAGLVGTFAVTKRNGLRRNVRIPKGTSEAYPLLLNIFRENESPFIKQSIAMYASRGNEITDNKIEKLQEDEDWLESNAMHSMNGYLYCNNPVLRARHGSKIRFYIFGFGSEASIHVPIWKGQVIQRETNLGNAGDGLNILPFNAESVDVLMTSRGLWAITCGVSDHVLGGMKARVRVY